MPPSHLAPAAKPLSGPRRPHSSVPPRWQPRTDGDPHAAQQRADQARATRFAQTDPNAASEQSSQPPLSRCCDDHLNSGCAQRSLIFALLALMLADIARADPATEALDALVAAYPELLVRHDGQSVFWRTGTVMRASDGRTEKSFDLLLKDASILEQFHLTYPRGRSPTPPALNKDPGRFRNEAFFRKMYGDCHKGEVDQRLVTITWLLKSWGKPVRVTDVNGVAEKLKAVSTEVDALPDALKRAAYPIAGVLACRSVRDTGRDSMHAYAAAIDLNAKDGRLLAVAGHERCRSATVSQPHATGDRRRL